MRPHQWLKNLLVLLVPLMAAKLKVGYVVSSFATVFAFCLMSSAIYVINDYVDRDRDKLHPTKKKRPLPSGAVRPSTAIGLSVSLVSISLVVSYAINIDVFLVLISYTIINIVYCYWTKHIPLIEMVSISSGFVLRVISGAFAIQATLNPNIVGSVAAASFSLITMKRRSELKQSSRRVEQRPVLANYSISSLDQIMMCSCCIAALLLIIATNKVDPTLAGITTYSIMILVVLAGLSHLFQIAQGHNMEDPARSLIQDRYSKIILAVMIILVTITARMSSVFS
jgi:4-hydroxybenzoate octaprenyltransferase